MNKSIIFPIQVEQNKQDIHLDFHQEQDWRAKQDLPSGTECVENC